MDGWMDRRTKGRTDGQTDGWMAEWTHAQFFGKGKHLLFDIFDIFDNLYETDKIYSYFIGFGQKSFSPISQFQGFQKKKWTVSKFLLID